METIPLYALIWWLLPFLLVLGLPWVVRKVRGPGPEPRMADANFLVKMRLHNIMKESQYLIPLMLLSAIVYLLLGNQDGGWHLLFGGFWLGASLAFAGRYFTCKQLFNVLKKEEELAR